MIIIEHGLLDELLLIFFSASILSADLLIFSAGSNRCVYPSGTSVRSCRFGYSNRRFLDRRRWFCGDCVFVVFDGS